MNLPFSLPLLRPRKSLFRAFLLSAFALPSHATPVFEPLEALISPPENPRAKLIQGSDGSFYGTTQLGGGANDFGAVFKMTASGTLTTLVNFNGANGRSPQAGLVQGSDGDFYGTTERGGSGNSGTIFKMTPGGTLTTLVSFLSSTNGSNPYAGLVQGSDGNFYGTTRQGGSSGNGTIFKMTGGGTLTTLVHFTGANGRNPYAGLVQGSDGLFYGTTSAGGSSNAGTVFKITSGGTLTTLVNFTTTNGSNPRGALVQGSDGNFYGTTSAGGSSNVGTVFKITSGGALTTLVNFTGTNGSLPEAELMQGSNGDFYGTTKGGGSGSSGTAFKMTTGGALTTLVNFTGANGSSPVAGLVQGSDGDFYGTNFSGGSGGYGTVFKMTASGSLTTLVNFSYANNVGVGPSGLIQASDGAFYGTTLGGGISGTHGTVFKMTPSGALTTLVHFTGANGSKPYAGLLQGADGNLYGTTTEGGGSGDGTVFKTTTGGSLTTLVNFTDAIGRTPVAGLVLGSDGNFYGTTESGGSGSVRAGTVFKMTPGGTLTTLVTFTGANGDSPDADLVQGSDGNFYGTTFSGGSSYNGTVFKITPAGTLSSLVSFTGTNGISPQAGLVQGSDGDFYGTTRSSIFKMTPSGTLTTLVNIGSLAGLIQGSDGNFYGTTPTGGSSGYGTVFKMTPAGALTTLVNFTGANGSSPRGALVWGNDGFLYGTTGGGGTTSDGQSAGGGQIFRLRMGPGVTSQAASNVAPSAATLNGTVNPGGYETPVSFQYGTDPTLATFTIASAGTLPAGTTDVAVQATVSGLVPGTTYYFRVRASNVENVVPQSGTILSFTTAAPNLDGGVVFPTPAAVPLSLAGFTATGQTVGPLALGFAPVPGQVLTLVNNTSASSIVGVFTNLPDGGTIATSYGGRNLLFVANYSGGDGNDLTLTLLNPEIAVEQPLLTAIADGAAKSFGTVALGSPLSLVFTIKNTGPGILNGLTITKSGVDEAAFVVTALPTAPLAGSAGITAFSVQFNPTTSGAKTAAIHIASDDADEAPFDIILTGTGETAVAVFNDAVAASSTLTGDDRLPTATPFGDGVENLLKYAFNMNLAGPDTSTLTPVTGSSGLPTYEIDEGAGEVRVQYIRRKGSGLVYTPQKSPGLEPDSFIPLGGSESSEDVDDQFERVTVVAPCDPVLDPRCFWRVAVSLPASP